MDYQTVQDLPPHRQGTTWSGARITIPNAEDELIDLTGANITMRIMDRADGEGTTLLDIPTDTGNVTIAGNGTMATFAPCLINVEPGTRHYRIKVAYGNGTVYVPVVGQWPILPEL